MTEGHPYARSQPDIPLRQMLPAMRTANRRPPARSTTPSRGSRPNMTPFSMTRNVAMTGRARCRQGLAVPTRSWPHPRAESGFMTHRSHAPHEKRDITAGQRGGLDKVGSRSLPRQERARMGSRK